MAHFALIEKTKVIDVIVIDNNECGGGIFPESEPMGQAFIAEIPLLGEWLQTSYSSSFRGTYAGIGYTYDAALDIFVAPTIEEK